MLITTPTDIANVIYQGPLEFSETNTERLTETNKAVTPEEIAGWDRPVVTIGEPIWWNIGQIYQAEGKLPPSALGLQLREADLFLLQMACSFRPSRHGRIEWARFGVYMRPRNTTASNPITLDLHPLEIYDKLQRDVRVSVSPSLKFVESVEASLGEVAIQLQYTELLPVMTAVGAQESNFSWDMRETREYPLRGVRIFHALIKCPQDARGVRTSFEVAADVITPRGLLQAAVHDKDATHLSRLIFT